jgi:hypothetical protein
MPVLRGSKWARGRLGPRGEGIVTPEQARARAKAILDAQRSGQVIQLNSDGTLSSPKDPARLGWGKKTVLNDPKGEYAPVFAYGSSAEYVMDVAVRGQAHRHEVERAKLASAFSTLAIDPARGVITAIIGSIQPIPGGSIRDFRITVPERYPNVCAHAFPIGWQITGPHQYVGNEMCLWQFNEWSPRYTLAYTVAKAFVWIHKHEEWLRSGIWPGKQQSH